MTCNRKRQPHIQVRKKQGHGGSHPSGMRVRLARTANERTPHVFPLFRIGVSLFNRSHDQRADGGSRSLRAMAELVVNGPGISTVVLTFMTLLCHVRQNHVSDPTSTPALGHNQRDVVVLLLGAEALNLGDDRRDNRRSPAAPGGAAAQPPAAPPRTPHRLD